MSAEAATGLNSTSIPSERRRWPRLARQLPDSDDYQISIAGIPPPIKVRDISRGGIGFTARHPARVGDGLDMWLYNEGLGTWLKKRVRVARVSGTRDAGYVIGGSFSVELTEVELQGFSDTRSATQERSAEEEAAALPAASREMS